MDFDAKPDKTLFVSYRPQTGKCFFPRNFPVPADDLRLRHLPKRSPDFYGGLQCVRKQSFHFIQEGFSRVPKRIPFENPDPHIRDLFHVTKKGRQT